MFANAPPRMPMPGMGNQMVTQGLPQGIVPPQGPPAGPMPPQGMPPGMEAMGGQRLDPRIMAYIKALMG